MTNDGGKLSQMIKQAPGTAVTNMSLQRALRHAVSTASWCFLVLALISHAGSGNRAGAGGDVVFPTDRLVIATADGERHPFNVELAVTPDQRSQGLMHRQSLADDAGMLFLFDRAEPRTFWMKNTFVSLDIIYLDGDGRVVAIAEATEPMSEALVPSGVPAQAVLEVPAGSSARLGIDLDTVVEYRFFGNSP